jgi:hypothetical protein
LGNVEGGFGKAKGFWLMEQMIEALSSKGKVHWRR